MSDDLAGLGLEELWAKMGRSPDVWFAAKEITRRFAALGARAEKAERERDNYRDLADDWKESSGGFFAERDALADALRDTLDVLVGWHGPDVEKARAHAIAQGNAALASLAGGDHAEPTAEENHGH